MVLVGCRFPLTREMRWREGDDADDETDVGRQYPKNLGLYTPPFPFSVGVGGKGNDGEPATVAVTLG